MINISYRTINHYIDKLICQIDEKGVYYDYVVGIANGGIPISTRIAEILRKRHTKIYISYYNKENERQKEPVINMEGLIPVPTDKKLLFVDDLVDSGATLAYLNKLTMYSFDTAVLFFNDSNPHGAIPTYFASFKPSDWLVFPWEDGWEPEVK